MQAPHLPNLPITEVLPALLSAMQGYNRAVLEAPPGAGKTTLVPLALLNADWRAGKKIIVLEPRRLATKTAAQRMASLLGAQAGQTVGYRVRMEQRVSDATIIEVVTEGILTRMLQDDPSLEDVAAILFDEFHERSLQADLGLALALDAQEVLRPDLRLLVMSATLNASALGQWLAAPVIRSEGRQYPIETYYPSLAELAAAGNAISTRLEALVPPYIRKALSKHPEGDVLVFLPGLGEIRKIAALIEQTLGAHVQVYALHGDLSLEQQTAALQPAAQGYRKVVLATSIAETSLTIQGVQIVIDAGYSRIPQFVPRTGLTSLATVPVSVATADQRRGRAGRLGPGYCYRLWALADQHRLLPHLPPEILEADLSGLALELAIWGSEISSLKFLNPPPAATYAQANDLLQRLGATDKQGKPTAHGKELVALGLPPRLGHLVLRGRLANLGATACLLAALLSERDIIMPLNPATADRRNMLTDVRTRLEILASNKVAFIPGFQVNEPLTRRIKEQASQLRQRAKINSTSIDPEAAGILTALAYPDKLAQKEQSGKVRLVTGQRASLATENFAEASFYGVAQLEAGQNPRVLLAAPLSQREVELHFADQIQELEEVYWDSATERVQARRIRKIGAVTLSEVQLQKPDSDKVSEVLLQAIQSKGIEWLPWSEQAIRVRQRLAFMHTHSADSWPQVTDTALEETLPEWLGPHLLGLRSMAEVARLNLAEILLNTLSWEQRNLLDHLAPASFTVPTGSSITINYADPDAPVLAVRLQEVFGLLETPRIAGGKVALVMHLLSPGHRPVQVTRDLRSFWASGYFEVRKDLRGRYPKHAWPEDPLTAAPQRGVKRRPAS